MVDIGMLDMEWSKTPVSSRVSSCVYGQLSIKTNRRDIYNASGNK
jgi:hypothetical protein